MMEWKHRATLSDDYGKESIAVFTSGNIIRFEIDSDVLDETIMINVNRKAFLEMINDDKPGI